jgi:L-ascorbate metabolism protein UlaG (beta-lactamase superfamily)
MRRNGGVQLTWLGHSTFKIEYDGKVLLIDPWVANNPACPDRHKRFDRMDVMLVTHGHFDHIGDAVPLAKAHHPTVVGIFETCRWLEKKGVEKTSAMNKGGTIEVNGLRVTMVHADHSCGILDDDGSIVYGGEAVGYVVEFPGGYRMYHAGDTNVFGDMSIIGDLYQPDIALLPVGDRFTMGPREAALAADMLGVSRVVPMHHGTFPLLTGTPEAVRDLLKEKGIEVVEIKPGETLA